METFIRDYILKLDITEQAICLKIKEIITQEYGLEEAKIWHAHPVWFINGNPIVGFSKQKKTIRLMFWSGADFEEPMLLVKGKKFKDASVFYSHPEEVIEEDLKRWLKKGKNTQWDYKNLIKRKGVLLKIF
jgi:hypothetical protein